MASAAEHTTEQPIVVGLLVSACLVATLPGLVIADLAALFADGHPWTPLTAAFGHGLPGLPAALHLFVAVAFVLLVGVPTERLLGTPLFALLTAGALGVAVATTLLAGTGVVGGTVFAWAYAPVLAAALWVLHREDAAEGPWPRRALALLVVLWVGVPALTLSGALASPGSARPALAATAANVVAGLVGVVAAVDWAPAVEDSLFYGPDDDSGLATTAAVAGYAALVAFLLVVLVLALAGVVSA